jgi:hypothetical protein
MNTITAHGTMPSVFKFGQPTWRTDGTCSYCGSISVAEAIRLLEADGTRYSGSDWKYGWPHKFYISNKSLNPHAIKFYNDHLIDATNEELKRFDELSKKYFGISFQKSAEGKLQYAAPRTDSFYGYQRWGVTGKTTCEKCGCVGGEREGYCHCPAKCHPDPEIPGAEK